MDKIQELRDKLGGLLTQARAILDKADDEKRALTQEEQNTYDNIHNDIDGVRRSIRNEERQRELEAQITKPKDEGGNRGKENPSGNETDQEKRMRGFRNFLLTGRESYASEVGLRALDLPAEYRSALQNDVDILGGYVGAPDTFVNEIIKEKDSLVCIRRLATKRGGIMGSLGYPKITTKMSGAVHGSEIGSIPEMTNLQFGKREWKPNPITGYTLMSNVFLAKTQIGAEAEVRAEIARVSSEIEEQDFMTGDGVNKSLGLFTASADGISTARDVSTGNTPTEIKFDGLKEAKYSLKQAYWPKAQWVFHMDAVKQIDKLKDGEGRYIWNDNVRSGEIPMLLGFPVNFSDFAPNTFSTGKYVGILGDFSYYLIADGLNLGVRVLKELRALNNQTLFLFWYEVDAMPKLEEAFVRVKLG